MAATKIAKVESLLARIYSARMNNEQEYDSRISEAEKKKIEKFIKKNPGPLSIDQFNQFFSALDHMRSVELQENSYRGTGTNRELNAIGALVEATWPLKIG